MKSYEVITPFRDLIKETDIIVSSNGNISREVFHSLPQPQIYLRGSMGLPIPVGLGYALANPGKQVIVITGDGNFLMGLGAMITAAYYKLTNLKILILDNNSYYTTGGQTTVSSALDYEKFFKSLNLETWLSKKAVSNDILEDLRTLMYSKTFTVFHFVIDQFKEDLSNIPLHPEEIKKLVLLK